MSFAINKLKKLLICGQGSIGRRYIDLISDNWPEISIGLQSSTGELDNYLRGKIDFMNSNLQICIDWEPDAAIICNPASLHIDTAIELLEVKIPTLIEKPIGIGNENIHKINLIKCLSKKTTTLIGYVLRYENGYELLKDIILKSKLGKIHKANFYCSSWLPDWRPGKDYRNSVSAQKNLGGGVLLELSHELDLALSLFGEIFLHSAVLKNSGKLEINVEDLVSLKGKSNLCEEILFELDFCSREEVRFVDVEGSEGKLKWDLKEGIFKTEIGTEKPLIYEFKSEKNEKYIKQVRHFFDCIQNNRKPKCEVNDGLLVLELISQAKKLSNLKI